MATQNPIIHSFKEVKRFKEVIHYELINIYNGKPQLSTKLNLGKDRNCAKSSPTYWITERTIDNNCIYSLQELMCYDCDGDVGI